MPAWLPSVFWLALLVVCCFFEAATVALVSVWFCVGSLCALVSSFFVPDIWTQATVFLVVSALTLAVLRPLARRYVLPHWVPTNADRVIGREAKVVEEINNLDGRGSVLILGSAWTARSETGEPIPAGAAVTVKRIEGVKLFVIPAQNRKESAA